MIHGSAELQLILILQLIIQWLPLVRIKKAYGTPKLWLLSNCPWVSELASACELTVLSENSVFLGSELEQVISKTLFKFRNISDVRHLRQSELICKICSGAIVLIVIKRLICFKLLQHYKSYKIIETDKDVHQKYFVTTIPCLSLVRVHFRKQNLHILLSTTMRLSILK